MIIRKLVSALFACMLVMFISFLIEPSGFVIIIGLYLFPILLFYGLPSSILSNYVTKKLKGIKRGGTALLIHLIFAAVFVIVILNYVEDWAPVNFFLLLSLGSSFLFWGFDELLKSNKAKQICMKIDDLKLH